MQDAAIDAICVMDMMASMCARSARSARLMNCLNASRRKCTATLPNQLSLQLRRVQRAQTQIDLCLPGLEDRNHSKRAVCIIAFLRNAVGNSQTSAVAIFVDAERRVQDAAIRAIGVKGIRVSMGAKSVWKRMRMSI